MVAAAWLLAPPPVGALDLARDGRALAPIRVAADASATERNAAAELAAYLGKITGAEFLIETGPGPAPSIEVGWTETIRESGLNRGGFGPEHWIVRTVDNRLWLTGGEPRGVLHAVYRFLEEDLGVEWWTPWDETVPHQRRLRVGELDRSGEPLFVYRDLFGVRGSTLFHARHRLNGHYSRLTEDWGGSLRFGPPFHVHTFDRRISAERHFDEHPEWFSQIDGFRYGGKTQWCLTNEALLDAAEEQVRGSIAEGERLAASGGESVPAYYDVSQNDWARPCECGSCSTLVEEEGSPSGPVIHFVDKLAGRIAAERPDLKISTLAYHFTFEPPREARAGEFVVVRLADLHQRDFAHELDAPANAVVRDAIRGWGAAAEHLQIWDYRVTFHDDGDLPRADHRSLAAQYRFYAENGVEGVFVQTEFADVADMRDLEVWLAAKLLEDPYRDGEELIRRFLRGYYGPAARPIANYLADLARAVERFPGRLRFAAPASDFEWLDPYLVKRAQRRFAAAERRVAGRPELLARVRGARVALYRATLARWDDLWPASGSRRGPWPKAEVLKRYETTRRNRIDQRLFGALQAQAFESLAREMTEWMDRDE